MVTSERTYYNMCLQGLLLPMPLLLRQATANLHLKYSQVDPAQCSAAQGSLLLSPGFWHTQGLFVPSKSGVCFPQYYGSPVIKSHWPLNSDSLGIPSPYASSPGWCRPKNLHNSRRTSSYYHHQPSRYEIWVYCDCAPPTTPWGFFFVFGLGLSFFGGFQCPPDNGCSTASCNFGVLTGEDKRTSFYSAILNQSLSSKSASLQEE